MPEYGTEKRVQKMLTDAGVEFTLDCPRIRNDRTNRLVRADIFVPKTKLHVEVKGQMTLDAILKLAILARRAERYYVIQLDEHAWRSVLMSSALEVLGEEEASRIHKAAYKHAEADARVRPARSTFGGLYTRNDLVYLREFQRIELLFLAKRAKLARRAGALTLARLSAYAHHVDEELRNYGLFGRTAPPRRRGPDGNGTF